MKFVLVPRGKFTMGSPVSEMRRTIDEAQREVAITKSFYLGIHEVTQDQFEKIMGWRASETRRFRTSLAARFGQTSAPLVR